MRRVADLGVVAADATRVAVGLGAVLGVVDLEPDVRHHPRMRLVRHVDDPRSAHGVSRRDCVEPERELVELEQVTVAMDDHRGRVLGDGHPLPGEPADLAHLGAGLTRLDL